MIKAVLIDDEPLARSIVKEYLLDWPDIVVAQECNDGFEGVKAIMQHRPDLVFLDVQMPKINGFEMLELVDPAPPVIFITAFDEYAIKAFEAHAVDYLLKPFSRERFHQSIQRWKQQREIKPEQDMNNLLKDAAIQSGEQQRVVVKNGNNIRIVPVQEIIYIEAYDDYVKIFNKDGQQLKKKTLTHFEQTLSPKEFVRVHRSYMVQIQQITRIEPFEKGSYVVLLKNGTSVPLSRSGYIRLKEVLGL